MKILFDIGHGWARETGSSFRLFVQPLLHHIDGAGLAKCGMGNRRVVLALVFTPPRLLFRLRERWLRAIPVLEHALRGRLPPSARVHAEKICNSTAEVASSTRRNGMR
jgi:hypothetical protein